VVSEAEARTEYRMNVIATDGSPEQLLAAAMLSAAVEAAQAGDDEARRWIEH
jgi:hypothetical protein